MFEDSPDFSDASDTFHSMLQIAKKGARKRENPRRDFIGAGFPVNCLV
jgi:hypothetical protein